MKSGRFLATLVEEDGSYGGGSSAIESLQNLDLFNPTEEHAALREMVRSFADNEVRPQALEFNREEKFNRPLFEKCGELGLLGVTVPEEMINLMEPMGGNWFQQLKRGLADQGLRIGRRGGLKPWLRRAGRRRAARDECSRRA